MKDRFWYMKPCDGCEQGELITALWQRTNGIERMLDIEYQYDKVHAPFPESTQTEFLQYLCERWSIIYARLDDWDRIDELKRGLDEM